MAAKQWSELLTPEKLKEYGALEAEIPKAAFNPDSDWELAWRIWLLKRRDSEINHRGYIHLKKECINSEKFHLYVEQKVLQVSHKSDYETNAVICCGNDLLAAPRSWELSRNFYNHITGEQSKNISDCKTGVIDAGILNMNISGSKVVHAVGGKVSSGWSLMEALMRCGMGMHMCEFTLLDELDKVKKNHILKYRGCETIPFGSGMVEVRKYEQTGNGFLPWSYYVDEAGRLLLAINGLRAYILDSDAKVEHDKITSSLQQEKNAEGNPVQGQAGCFVNTAGNIGETAEEAAGAEERRPNILLVTTDQQSLNTISAYGNKYINTPNMDKLVKKGVSFMKNYSTNPVCSPARSSIFTGRTTCETGVIDNEKGIREDMPNIGQWLNCSKEYETVYCGKWHVPEANPEHIDGFTVLPGGLGGQGTLGDQAVSSASAGWLMNRKGEKPFFLTVNFLQPHDICNWGSRHKNIQDLIFDIPEDELPPLPDNFHFDADEPELVGAYRKTGKKWSHKMWRYYIWSYYRMVEEVDAEIGRVLDALEASGNADNTVVIFTSDHGEGGGHHQLTTKNFLYDEAVRVPLIISGPGIIKGKIDLENLASGLDIMPTVCDLTGIIPPDGCKGISLKPACEGRPMPIRAYVVAEVGGDKGRMIRSKDWKLIAYRDEPLLQLFDMRSDPGETINLANHPDYSHILDEHRKLLNEWEAALDRAPNALPQFKL